MAKVKKAQDGAKKVKSKLSVKGVYFAKGKPVVKAPAFDIERSYDTTGYSAGRKKFPVERKFTNYEIESYDKVNEPKVSGTRTTYGTAKRKEVDKAIKTPYKESTGRYGPNNTAIRLKQKNGGKTVPKKTYGGTTMKKGGKIAKKK